MKTSVYISSEKLYVLQYAKGSIRNYISKPLPEGCSINGLITDPAPIVECLSAVKAAHPSLFQNVVLVLDGSSIPVKRIEAPKLGKRQYDQLIRYDFAHTTEQADDLVCGYQVLNEAAGAPAILACAADVSLVDGYMDAFAAAGITLDAVHVGIQAIMHYIAGRGDLTGKTFVLNVVDGFTLLSMIFDCGRAMLIQRSRLYGEDELQLADSIRGNLSGLLQFAKSEQLSDITDSYYLGISDETMALLDAQNIFSDVNFQKLNIGAPMAGGKALPDDAHFVYLNTQLPDKSIDLIQGRKERTKRQVRNRPKRRWLPILILFTLVAASPAVLFFLLGRSLDGEIRQVQDYINAPSIVLKMAEIDALEQDTSKIAAILRQRDAVAALMQGVVPVSDDLVSLVFNTRSSDVSINSFDYTERTGILYINATCQGESIAARYVDALRGNSRVMEIGYTGYSYRSTGEYDFSLEVTLNTEQEVAE